MNKEIKSKGSERMYKTFMHPVTSIFIVTIIITFVLTISGNTSIENIVSSWGSGLKDNFGYAMQFMLLLLLGYTLAMTPIYLKIVKSMGKLFKSEKSGIIGLVLFSAILSWFNWALGVVGGVFLAQAISLAHRQKNKVINFPLLVAAGLSGLVISESGLSGNVILFMTNASDKFNEFPSVSLSNSTISTLNILINLIVIVGLILVLVMFSGKDKSEIVADVNNVKDDENKKPECIAEVMESSQIVSIIFGLIGLSYIVLHLTRGGIMDLNTYLILLIALGIVLRKKPISFQIDVTSASSYAWIFFFPLIFAGTIQGMLSMDTTSDFLSNLFTSITTENTFASFNMINATIVNFIIPNSGAVWLIEGPSILSAGQILNISTEHSIMSFCYGAGVAKLLNVFVLLPIITLVNIKFRAIFKYVASMALVSAIIYLIMLFIV